MRTESTVAYARFRGCKGSQHFILLITVVQVSHEARGILGETFVPTFDDRGEPIMTGMDAIRGTQEECKSRGPR